MKTTTEKGSPPEEITVLETFEDFVRFANNRPDLSIEEMAELISEDRRDYTVRVEE